MIGPRFGVDDVDEVIRRDPLPALERALAAGLVREDRDGTLAFAHALVQETLLAELSTVRRVRLHRQVAEVLAARDGDVSEIARHRFEAAAGGGGAEAAAALVAAGDAALAAFAYETAAANFWRAIEVDPSQRSRLLLRVGDALLRAGETQRGRAVFLEAASLARASGEHDVLARAALGRSGIGVVIRAVDREQVALLEEALAGSEDEALRAALLARLAIETYYDRDPARRTALADEAVAIARRLGDPATLAAALNAQRVARWDIDHLAERRAISEELVAMAVAAGDPAAELQGRNWLVVDLLDASERAAAEEEIGRYELLAERHRIPSHGWYVPAWRAALADADGHDAEAERLRGELAAYRDRGIDPNIDLVLQSQAGVRRLLRGDASYDDDEIEFVRAAAAQPHVAPAWNSGLALMEALRGDHEAARRHLELSGRPRDAERDVNWPSVMWEQGATAILLDDPVLAREVRDLLAPFADMTVTAIRGTIVMGPVRTMLERLDAYLASAGA